MFHERPHRSRLTNARAIITVIVLGLSAAKPANAAAIDFFSFGDYFEYGNLFFEPMPGSRATISWGFFTTGFFWAGDDLFEVSGDVTATTGLFKSYTEVSAQGVTLATTSFDGRGRLDFAFTLNLPGGGTHTGALHALLGPTKIEEYFCGFPCGGLVYPTFLDVKFDAGTAGFFGVSTHLIGLTDEPLNSDVYTGVFPDIPEHFDRVFGALDFEAQVPEPSTLLLLGAGVAFVAHRRRRH